MQKTDVRWVRRLCVFVCLAGAVVTLGCDTGPKRLPVSGKVTLDGAPLKSGTVMFVPDTSKGNNAKGGMAGKIEDGTYKITTDGKDGAELGWYKVTLVTKGPGMPEDAPDINPKYSDATKTDLSVQVVESPPAGAYDLKVTK